MTRSTLAVLSALAFATPVGAQAPVDSSLAAYIAAIKAIDVHAHPLRYVAPGAPADSEFDALPLDAIPAFGVPWRMRPESAPWSAAARALYDVRGDTGEAYRKALGDARARVQREQGERFPNWVLDRAGVETMLANRIVLGAGLAAPRFRWVAFADPLMLPLDNRGEGARTPDTRSLYPHETALLARYRRELGVRALPATLDAYVKTVLVPTLTRQHDAGAVGVKFEAAYLRPLDFDDASAADARRIYARYAAGGVPSHADYKTLEDHLFRVIAREAGRLGMGVQIHVLAGFGGFYPTHGSAPHMLEPAFNDSTLRGTNFVVVHGGWPLVGETHGLLTKPNVYADISMMSLLLSPARLAAAIRPWLSEWPDKVLFGSDAFDSSVDQGWDQGLWIASTTARGALAIALTSMMRDGEIDRARAETIARMVMRENALVAYKLAPKS